MYPTLMPDPNENTMKIIAGLVRRVEDDEDAIGVMSMGETIAVALVLDRKDLLPTGMTMLDAVDRLGLDWVAAALAVHKNGWDGDVRHINFRK